MKFLILSFFLMLAGCSSEPSRSIAQAANTKYYFGEVEMSSADGKTSYGKTVSLVQRTVEPSKDRILEIVLQPPRDPKKKPKDIQTTLSRVDDSETFKAADEGRTFTGTMRFEGIEWAWNQWTYDLQLVDGSRIIGSGKLSSSGMTTEKIFYKPDGKASVVLKEDLRTISAEDYKAQHRKMLLGGR